MKYYAKTDANALIKRVIGEMVNITLGETYFNDLGELLSTKKPNHNTYIIDTVEYQIYPNIGFVYVLDANDQLFITLKQCIEFMFHEAVRLVASRFDIRDVPNTINITTQYLSVINTKSALLQNITFAYNVAPQADVGNSSFSWRIIHGNMPIGHYTNSKTHIYSLSSIVVDFINCISLPDGFRHSDFPSYKNYVKGNKIHPNAIDFHPSYGIHRELAKHYPNVSKPYKTPVFGSITNRKIYLVKWKWLRFYSMNPESNVSYYDQIKMGLLDTEPSEEVLTNCFATNMPIYDDCYVFDIKSRMVEEIINEEDLPKYPGAILISMMDDEEKEIKGAALEHFESSKAPEPNKVRIKPSKAPEPVENPEPSEAPEPDEDVSVEFVDKKVAKKTSKIAKKTAKPTKKALPKIIKRGTSEPAKMIKIVYKREYRTQRCILISPYYVHLMDSNDQIRKFESLTGTEVMVYRTKAPTTTLEAIKNSNACENTKEILTLLYQSAFVKGYDDYRCIDSNKIFTTGCQSTATTNSLQFTKVSPDTLIQIENTFE